MDLIGDILETFLRETTQVSGSTRGDPSHLLNLMHRLETDPFFREDYWFKAYRDLLAREILNYLAHNFGMPMTPK